MSGVQYNITPLTGSFAPPVHRHTVAPRVLPHTVGSHNGSLLVHRRTGQNDHASRGGRTRTTRTGTRRCVDYQALAIEWTQKRLLHRYDAFKGPYRPGDMASLQPISTGLMRMLPPYCSVQNPIAGACTRYVHTSRDKHPSPVNVVSWTPEGRRLVAGGSNGKFTLWNGLQFNFEITMQAHETAVRVMRWSHNGDWMVCGDDGGVIKYWQSNLNNVKAFSAHRESVRDLAFCPLDLKFASCGDDRMVKIWDFASGQEEQSLSGHGWDCKAVDWHPTKGLVFSGGKDSLIKAWDPRSGRCVCTVRAHKSTVSKIRCNQNGNWFLTGSRDQLMKLFDVRTMRVIRTFREHVKEVTAIAWSPLHEQLFASGGADGSVHYWLAEREEAYASVNKPHESAVWSISWHPLGHMVATGSNDHSTKFWCRNRPFDHMSERWTSGHTRAGAVKPREIPQPPQLEGEQQTTGLEGEEDASHSNQEVAGMEEGEEERKEEASSGMANATSGVVLSENMRMVLADAEAAAAAALQSASTRTRKPNRGGMSRGSRGGYRGRGRGYRGRGRGQHDYGGHRSNNPNNIPMPSGGRNPGYMNRGGFGGDHQMMNSPMGRGRGNGYSSGMSPPPNAYPQQTMGYQSQPQSGGVQAGQAAQAADAFQKWLASQGK